MAGIVPTISEISEMSSGSNCSELKQLLECPVCLEIPTGPPIYTCKTGHIVCENCHEQLNFCGLCKAPFLGTRSFTAEAMLHTIKIECRHRGCLEVLKGSELSGHLKTCSYRPVPCFETRTRNCNGALVDLDQFESHLKHSHKTEGVDEPSPGHEFTELSNDIKSDERWPLFYFRFDNNLFLRHLLIQKGTLYWWVTLVGREEEAQKYRIGLLIYRKSDKKTMIQWNHPIHSNQHTFEEIQQFGDCAGIYKDVLTSYCRETDNFKYAFSTRYTVTKVESKMEKITFASLKITK